MSEFQLKGHHEARSFFDGARAGIELYAHWKDGVKYVGSCGRTLKEALADVDVQEHIKFATCRGALRLAVSEMDALAQVHPDLFNPGGSAPAEARQRFKELLDEASEMERELGL